MKILHRVIMFMMVIMILGFSVIAITEDKGSLMDENSIRYKINKVSNDLRGKITKQFDSQIK